MIDPSPVWYVGVRHAPEEGQYIIAQYKGVRKLAVIRGTEVRSQHTEDYGRVICQVSELQAWKEDND